MLGRPGAVLEASRELSFVVAFGMVALVVGVVERVEDARRVTRVEKRRVLLVLGAQPTVRERAALEASPSACSSRLNADVLNTEPWFSKALDMYLAPQRDHVCCAGPRQ